MTLTEKGDETAISINHQCTSEDDFVELLSRSGAVCSVLGWLARLVVRRERISDAARIRARLGELIARIKAVLRRVAADAGGRDGVDRDDEAARLLREPAEGRAAMQRHPRRRLRDPHRRRLPGHPLRDHDPGRCRGRARHRGAHPG